MMIDQNGKLMIIDFDRSDVGDPWEEFNRMGWCIQKAPVFANGMVDGYFETTGIPDDFWKLLILYMASNTLSSLPWAVSYGETQIAIIKQQAREFLSWHEDMRRIQPNWYHSKSISR